MHRGRNKTTKTTLRSERISALKKDLTRSPLLEMYGYPTYQDLARVLSGAWSGITVSSHAPNDPIFRQKLFIWRQGYDWRTEPRPNLKVVGRRLPRDAKTDVYTLFSQESSRNS